MPDLPDILTHPARDLAHEAYRVAIVQALTHLADHFEQLADAFLLGETAADGLGIALTNFVALQQAVASQAQEIADLRAQVAALQSPPAA